MKLSLDGGLQRIRDGAAFVDSVVGGREDGDSQDGIPKLKSLSLKSFADVIDVVAVVAVVALVVVVVVVGLWRLWWLRYRIYVITSLQVA